jgi:hypothetical protein
MPFKPYLLRPTALPRFFRVRAALSDYPVYDPPHHKNSAFLDFESARENRQYFLDHRAVRLDALRRLLRGFEVDLALQGAGLAAVSAWFPRYGGLLAKRPLMSEGATPMQDSGVIAPRD